MTSSSELSPEQEITGSLHALSAALYWRRQAQARRDALGTLKGFQMVAAVADLKNRNAFLRIIPRVIFEDVIEPLREMRFASTRVESVWANHRDYYRRKVGGATHSLDLIDCLQDLFL